MVDVPADLLTPLRAKERARKSKKQSSLDGKRCFKSHIHSQGKGIRIRVTRFGLEIFKDAEDEDILR